MAAARYKIKRNRHVVGCFNFRVVAVDVEMDQVITQFFWLAACIYFEARGEPERGRRAVAHIILNRAEERGQSVEDVVLSPYQFSWANNGNRPAIDDYTAFIKCAESAQAALAERLQGNTFQGANHYHATYIDPPSWARTMEQIETIGQHIFYKS